MTGFMNVGDVGQPNQLDMNVTEQTVWYILKLNPETRNNDKLLTLYVWEREGLELTDSQKRLFMEVSFSETITRIRRKIQAGGMFKADPYKHAQRNLWAIKKRQEFRKKEPYYPHDIF